MRSSRRFATLSLACGLTWGLAAAASSAQPPAAPAPEPLPSAIEEALIEYACAQLHPAGTVESDAYLDCRKNRLSYLRAEFGRDLRRLSATERKTIDTACSDLRASRGQDAYVQCLQAKLATLPGHGKAKAKAASRAADPPQVPSVTPPAAPSPVAPSASPLSPLTIGAAVAALLAAGAGTGIVLLKYRGKPAAGACRTCGAAVQGHGELCPNCRHEAAEALRHASTERAAHARAQDDAKRPQADQERQQQQAREDEARRRELAARQAAAAAARQQEDDAQRRREDDAWRQRQVDATAAPNDFDAHAALGVPRGASAADIEAAYQSARATYDLDVVADLGNELQEHYKRKAAAAQRAYEVLVAERQQ